MSDDRLKSAPLAYQNEPFLNSPDGRILRILSEYSEPLSRFRREQIQDTVVFFGSARFHSRADAEDRLKEVQNLTSLQDHGEELARAQAAVKMARYYEDARKLAYMLTDWSIKIPAPPPRLLVNTRRGAGLTGTANRRG